jgi:hypothetical protein
MAQEVMVVISFVLVLVNLTLVGLFEAVMDKINFHFENSIFSLMKNQQFWNPRLSWRNKWRNGNKEDGPKFFLSSTLLVFTTDAWHRMKFYRNLCLVLAMLNLLNSGWVGLVAIITGRVLWGVTFEYFFSTVFEKKIKT